MDNVDIKTLTDDELWARAEELARRARGATADLIEALAELDRRGLPMKRACESLHESCVHRFGMSDASAYRHIRAARAIQLFPPIAPALRSGRFTLEAIAILHPFLKDPDASELVALALGKRVSEVERLVALRRTEEPRRDVVRFIAKSPPPGPAPESSTPAALFLPASTAEPPAAAKSPAATPPGRAYESRAELYASVPPASKTVPSAPARHDVRIAFTADEAFGQLLEEVQAAMRHKYPDGRLEGIFRDALKALLKKNRPWAVPKAGN